MRNDRPVLELRRASIRLGERLVFRDTDWVLRRGEHWAIVGPTGSGKTVFCRALCGELPVAGGGLEYGFGRHAGREPESLVELVSLANPQGALADGAPARWFSLDQEESPKVAAFLSRNAVEDINPFEVVRRSAADAASWDRRARRIVRLLGIGNLMRRTVLALSNGEHRKVALARALMRHPRVLVFDDPFAGLDAAFRAHLRAVLERLIRHRVASVLLVGADPADWPRGLTHVMRIDRFRVAARGTRAAMRREPGVARLIGSSRDSRAAPPAGPRGGGKPGRELVRFRDVEVRWGDAVVLEHVDWTVREGESWAIVGPNGSGKTMLLSYILGENPQAYAQDVRIFGRNRGSGESVWDLKRRIGWVSPELHLSFDPGLDGLEVVLTGLQDGSELRQAPSSHQRAAAGRWLRRLRVAHLAGRLFGEASVGEQRMLLLARALVKSPRLLVLDEPCQGLDRRHRADFLDAVEGCLRRGATALYVTHRREEIPPSIRRVLRLRAGRARPGRLDAVAASR